MSQADVAALLDMTQQNLSLLESGTRSLSMETRRLVIDRLGLPPEELGLASLHGRRMGMLDTTAGEVAASRSRWRAERQWLNQHRAELARLAVRLYPDELSVPGTPLLTQQSWLPRAPLPLRDVSLILDNDCPVPQLTGREPQTSAVRPFRLVDTHFDRYTSALRHLDPPRLFESRPSYRLIGTSSASQELTFGMAAYFDKLDVSEALGHELAAACLAVPGGITKTPEDLNGRLPFRSLVGAPFDLARRAVVPAITTLTIRLRRWPAEPSFLLHWRDPAQVATAGGVYDVIPAGEFQPSSVLNCDLHNDFDLWRNIVREYAEELLGEPEHDGTRTAPIAYREWDLYQGLDRALSEGKVTASILGIGLDALTLAATILTVVVIDDDVFSRWFGSSVTYNQEGEIVAVGGNHPIDGIPFTASCVDRLLTSEPIASPGAACLALAWQHRDHLLCA